MEGVFLESVQGFLAKCTYFFAKWTGFSCKVDGVFLQSGVVFFAKWTGFSFKVDGVFLQSGRGFLAKWMGFSCKVDGGFLKSGRGFLAKWTGVSCKVDRAFLSIVKVKSIPSPRPKTGFSTNDFPNFTKNVKIVFDRLYKSQIDVFLQNF